MNIDEIKNELKPRKGLMEETLEKASGEKIRKRGYKFAAAAVCAALVIAAAVLVLTNGNAPGGAEAAAPRETDIAAQKPIPQMTAKPDPKEQIETDSEGQLVEGANIFTFTDSASVIFEGVCESSEFLARRVETDMEITVTRVMRGDVSVGDRLPVRTNGGEDIRTGEKYLLLCEQLGSVFENKELYYQADAYFTAGRRTELHKTLEDIRDMEYDELVELVAEYAANNEYKGDRNGHGLWCNSDDLAIIAAFSDTVARVRVVNVYLDEIKDRTTYTCSVAECLKGEAFGQIRVVSFKRSMEPGKEYLLLLTHSEGDLYVVSSHHSVLDPHSDEALQVIGALGQ